MANIRIDLDSPVTDGQSLVFKSPVNCSDITGLIIYFPGGSSTIFDFADAHGNNVGSLNLFSENALVKVLLDTELNRAYVQNADTNAYLEGELAKRLLAIESPDYPGCYYRKVGNEVEWINPPMIAGVHYRTIERFKGKPVYVTVFTEHNFNPTGNTYRKYLLPMASYTVIDAGGTMSDGRVLPHQSPDNEVYLYTQGSTVTVDIIDNPTISVSATVWCKYIKDQEGGIPPHE